MKEDKLVVKVGRQELLHAYNHNCVFLYKDGVESIIGTNNTLHGHNLHCLIIDMVGVMLARSIVNLQNDTFGRVGLIIVDSARNASAVYSKLIEHYTAKKEESSNEEGEEVVTFHLIDGLLGFLDLRQQVSNVKKSPVSIMVTSGNCLLFLFGLALMNIKTLDFVLFDNLSPANGNHPYCIFMEVFYERILSQNFANHDPTSSLPLPRIVAFSKWPTFRPGESFNVRLARHQKLNRYQKLFRSSIIPLFDETISNISVNYCPLEEIQNLSNNSICPNSNIKVTVGPFSLSNDEGEEDEEKSETIYISASDSPVDLGNLVSKINLNSTFALDTSPLSITNFAIILKYLTLKGSLDKHRNRVIDTFWSNFDGISSGSKFLKEQSRVHFLNTSNEAILIPHFSPELLSAICSYFEKVPGTKTLSTTTFPVERVSEDGVNLDKRKTFFISQVHLPSVLAVKNVLSEDELLVSGPISVNRSLAAEAAAFTAIVFLHQKGILDDNFLPIKALAPEDTLLQPMETNEVLHSEPEAEVNFGEGDNNEEETFSSIKEIVPDELCFDEVLWREKINSSDDFVEFYLISVNYNPSLQNSAELSQFSSVELPCDTIIHLGDLNFFSSYSSGRSIGILLPKSTNVELQSLRINLGSIFDLQGCYSQCSAVKLSKEELNKLMEFQVFLFGAINPYPMDPNIRQTINGESVIQIPNEKKLAFLVAWIKTPLSEPLPSVTDAERIKDSYIDFLNNSKNRSATSRITVEQAEVVNQWEIDWETIDLAINVDKYPKLSEIIDDLEKIEFDNISFDPPQFITSPEKPPTIVDFKLFALRRMIYYAPWNGLFYRCKKWKGDMAPSSAFTSKTFPTCSTYAEYMNLRYGMEVLNADREGMVECRRVENFVNISKWVSKLDTPKSKKDQQKGHKSIMIPEISRLVPVPYAIIRLSLLVPRILADIEWQLLAVQFYRDQLPSLRSFWPSTPHMITALAGTSARCNYDYERMETLGDSILKVLTTIDTFINEPSKCSEQHLTQKRQKMLTNLNLLMHGNQHKLYLYCRTIPFTPKVFSPPSIRTFFDLSCTQERWPFFNMLFDDGLQRWKNVEEMDRRSDKRQALHHIYPDGKLVDIKRKAHDPVQLRHRFNSSQELPVFTRYGFPIAPKTLADLVEAIIASFYLGEAKLDGAIEFLIASQVCLPSLRNYREFNDLSKTMGFMEEHMVLAQGHARADLVHPMPYAPNESIFPYDQIEKVLGYQFTNKRLLFLAFTHSSVDVTFCYERLEWLGDAVLDWIVTRYYWEDFDDVQWMTPSKLTQIRLTATSNDAFSRVLIMYNLHPYIRISSSSLQVDIGDFIDLYAANQKAIVMGQLPPAPKVLADVWEAIAGAIFLDLNFDFGKFNEIMLPLMMPYLREYADPYETADHPLAYFWRITRMAGCRYQVSFKYDIPPQRSIDIPPPGHVLCSIMVKGKIISQAVGANRLYAKYNACRLAAEFLQTDEGWKEVIPRR